MQDIIGRSAVGVATKSLTEAGDLSFNASGLGFIVERIEQTLLKTNGNVAKAARILNLSVSYLHWAIRQGIVNRS